MESPRSYFASVTFDSRILAIGGERFDQDVFQAIADVEAYDEQVQLQTSKKIMTPRSNHAAVVAEIPYNLLLRDEDNENWISYTDFTVRGIKVLDKNKWLHLKKN